MLSLPRNFTYIYQIKISARISFGPGVTVLNVFQEIRVIQKFVIVLYFNILTKQRYHIFIYCLYTCAYIYRSY